METRTVAQARRGSRFGAYVLIGLGGLFLAENVLYPLLGIHILNWGLIGPAAMIGVGLYIIAKKSQAQ
jgi:hypothetical protein